VDNFKFMDSWPAWVRWVLVLPATVAAWASIGLLASLAPAGLQPELKYRHPELLLMIFGVAIVWCGAATAPRFKLGTALLLGIALWIFTSYLMLSLEYVSASTHSWGWFWPWFVGVLIAWGLILWGYLRRRQAGLASR
jgi:hypothetical protein